MGRVLNLLKKLPLDCGQAEHKHDTMGKVIALRFVPRPTPGKRVRALDIGCRDGYFSELLKRKGYQVDSVDVEPKYKHAKVLDANKRMPWPSKTFDLIWCSEVIEHLYNPRYTLSEFRRILKPGGRLIITTPNSGCWIYGGLKMVGIPPHKAQNPDHKQFFKRADMKRLFPRGQVYGYYPYALLKFQMQKGIGFLSPTYVVIEDKAK